MTRIEERVNVRPHVPAREVRRARRDDALAGTWMIVGFHPMRIPARAVLVDALRRIAEADPMRRVALRDTGHGWSVPGDEELEARCDQAVVELEGPLGDLDDVVAAIRPAIDPRIPVRFLVSGQTLIQVTDHRLGDGGFASWLAPALFEVAAGGDVPPAFVEPEHPAPLRAALRATWGRHPGDAMRVVREKLAGEPAAQAAAARTGPVPAPSDECATTRPVHGVSGRDPHSREPDATPDERPRTPAVASAAIRQADYRAIRGWARTHGASPTVVDLGLARRSLEAQGVALADESTVLVDLRRYLPAGASTSGNFVVGHPIPTPPGWTPDDGTAALKRALASGRPLAAYALGTLRGYVARPGAGPVSRGATRPRLTVTSLGRLRAFETLPWAAGPDGRRLVVYIDPGDRGTVTICTVVIDGVLHATLSHDAALLAPELAGAAMAAAALDPVGLLGDG